MGCCPRRCNRENRHRGVCNTRAAVPGAPPAAAAAELATVVDHLTLDNFTGAPLPPSLSSVCHASAWGRGRLFLHIRHSS